MTAQELVQAMITKSTNAGGMEMQMDASDHEPVSELADALLPLSASNTPPNPPDDCGHHFYGADSAWHVTVCME